MRLAETRKCQACGARAGFRLYFPDGTWQFFCDTHARRKMQDVWDRFHLALNCHPLREEGAVGGGVGGWL